MLRCPASPRCADRSGTRNGSCSPVFELQNLLLGGHLLEVGDDEALLDQIVCSLIEPPARVGVVAHALAGLPAADFAGVRGDKADADHQLRPFLIVVALLGDVPEMVLPQVHHFMRERGQRFFVTQTEVQRIECDLVRVDHAVERLELLVTEVAHRSRLALEGDQARGELVSEQDEIQETVGVAEVSVSRRGRIDRPPVARETLFRTIQRHDLRFGFVVAARAHLLGTIR